MWRTIHMTVALLCLGNSMVYAADMEIKVADKNCWIEVFDDSEYDIDDPHIKIQGPAEFTSLKDLNGRDWNNDIESVIVGTNATVHAWKEKDLRGPRLPLHRVNVCPNSRIRLNQ
jgi:hypothetical protein